MKKLILIGLTIIHALVNYGCEATETIKETFDALDCANLIAEIDEDYDREDKDCSEISSDIDKILKRCSEFIDEEDRAQLEFYRDNCSDD